MSLPIIRPDGRAHDQIRPFKVFFDALGYADASVLFELGNTKVLVSISLQANVPPFLKGQRVGWLSAEYAMLPCATQQRTMRESSQAQRNTRSVEISRLIGRCLRTCVSLEVLGERTILVDCDVLQADGSTRVSAITAASLALEQAINRWHHNKIIEKNIFKYAIAAVSVGMINETAYLDLNYEEDSNADVDFNIIMTKSGDIIEIQGTAEKMPISWGQFEQLKQLATKGIAGLFACMPQLVQPVELFPSHHAKESVLQKSPLFSLGNRLQKTT
jgi:ribonuclease PH